MRPVFPSALGITRFRPTRRGKSAQGRVGLPSSAGTTEVGPIGQQRHCRARDYTRLLQKYIGSGGCWPPCSDQQIKKAGVNEGFAKVTAGRATGISNAWPPTADNVADILKGSDCAARDSSCAHDLGNLVFDAYKKLVAEMGESGAFDVYREALLRLQGSTISPGTLHGRVSDILEERAPSRIPIPLPDIPDPFMLLIWEAWLAVYWAWC